MGRLFVVPLTLREANGFVAALHRHHKPVQGHKFSIGAKQGNKLVGVVIIGRPVASSLFQLQLRQAHERWSLPACYAIGNYPGLPREDILRLTEGLNKL